MAIPQIIVEAQFTAGVWTDISAYLVLIMNTKRGASRVQSPVIRYEAGKATIRLKNSDRRFDPANTAGPYVSGGVSQVTPMRPIRIKAVWNSITYNVFRGFADYWDVAWYPPNYSEVTVPLTDGFKVLANNKRPTTIQVINGQPVTVTYGEGDDTGARITRILNSTDWPVADRSIATGNSTLQATSLSGDALSEMQEAAESEIGELYVDGQGRVFFRNRHALITETRSNTSQATFSSASLRPFKTKIATDDGPLYNQALITNKDGTTQIYNDTASQALYLTRTHEKSNLMLQTDAEALNYGQWLIRYGKDPEVRYDFLTFDAHVNGSSLFPHALGREIGDRITISFTPPGGGAAITKESFIRGITHNIRPLEWTTTFDLQSAATFGNFFTLNHASLGLLGSGTPMIY